MFSLNFVASRVFELLKGGSTEPAIVDVISREFNVARSSAENDIREFISALKEHRLIEDRTANG